jgi:hypothetical protein
MKSKKEIAVERYYGMHHRKVFLEGVKYAETWISVNDELPEIPEGKTESDTLILKSGETIFIGNYGIDHLDGTKLFWTNHVMSEYPITHWRYLNVK